MLTASSRSVMKSPSARMHARSITLRSSRTLPSHAARRQHPLGAGRQAEQRLLQALARLAHERGRQIRNVLAPIAQRRQLHFDDVEAVVEVAAEPPGGHFRAQIAVGRGDARGR